MNLKRGSLIILLSLFTSAGTLVCCALPALFVSLGLGAALAGLVTRIPALIWLSEHKPEVFGAALLLLALAGATLYRARNLPCPADAAQARACGRARRLSIWIYAASVLLFLTGAFFAFVAPALLEV